MAIHAPPQRRLATRLRVAACAALAALAPPPPVAHAQPASRSVAPDKEILYTVRRGDTLSALALRGMRRLEDHREVQALNRVADPYNLAIGSTLRIPVRLLRFRPLPARVAAFRGDARLLRAGRETPLALNAPLRSGDALLTGADGFASLALADGSVVALPSRSRLRLLRLEEAVLTGDSRPLFALDAGRAQAEAAPRRGRSTFSVATPVAHAAVRGTSFRLTFDPADTRTAVTVVEGAVATAAGGPEAPPAPDASRLQQGQGLVADAAGLGPARPLLPAPALRSTLLRAEGPPLLEVAPVPGAARYRAQVAADAGFIDVLAEVESVEPRLAPPRPAPGALYARLTALDPGGLEGLPTDLALEPPARGYGGTRSGDRPCAVGRCLWLRWAPVAGAAAYRVQFADGPDQPPWADDTHALPELELDDPQGGAIWWRVGAAMPGGELRWQRWRELRVIRQTPAP